MTSSLTKLQALRCLELAVELQSANFQDGVAVLPRGLMLLDVNWSALHVLQSVNMSSSFFACDKQLLTLSQVPSFTLILLGKVAYIRRFLMSFPENNETYQMYAELMYCLARQRLNSILFLDKDVGAWIRNLWDSDWSPQDGYGGS